MLFDIEHFSQFGTRLRDERKRLKLTQSQMAVIGGVSRGSQVLYEQSAHVPSMDYISRLVEQGVDFRYLVLGEHSPELGGRLCLDPNVLEKAMGLADQLCRDDRGHLLEAQIRHSVLKMILVAVAEKTEDQVEWGQVKAQIGARGFNAS
ncbi:MAG: helix-turn-helix transcriptional regulator [Candidatus Thiodiazotropha endolucinida]